MTNVSSINMALTSFMITDRPPAVGKTDGVMDDTTGVETYLIDGPSVLKSIPLFETCTSACSDSVFSGFGGTKALMLVSDIETICK